MTREVLVAHYIDGESCVEIGKRHGCTEQTIRNWLRGAVAGNQTKAWATPPAKGLIRKEVIPLVKSSSGVRPKPRQTPRRPPHFVELPASEQGWWQIDPGQFQLALKQLMGFNVAYGRAMDAQSAPGFHPIPALIMKGDGTD